MESYKDVLYVHVMIKEIKRTCHRVVIYYKLCYIWHQSLKSIHYRTLLIFQNKKKHICGSKHGGDKRHVIPLCQNMEGIYHPRPPRVYALGGKEMKIRYIKKMCTHTLMQFDILLNYSYILIYE